MGGIIKNTILVQRQKRLEYLLLIRGVSNRPSIPKMVSLEVRKDNDELSDTLLNIATTLQSRTAENTTGNFDKTKSIEKKKNKPLTKSTIPTWEQLIDKYGAKQEKPEPIFTENTVSDMLKPTIVGDKNHPMVAEISTPLRAKVDAYNQAKAATKLYEDEIQKLLQQKRELNKTFNGYNTPNSPSAPSIDPTKPIKDTIDLQIQVLQDQVDAIKNDIYDQVDPNRIVAAKFKQFSAPKLLNAAEELYIREGLLKEAKAQYDAGKIDEKIYRNILNEWYKAVQENDKLHSRYAYLLQWMKTFGLPDDVSKIPESVRKIAEEVIPNGNLSNEAIEAINKYAYDKAKLKPKTGGTQANYDISDEELEATRQDLEFRKLMLAEAAPHELFTFDSPMRGSQDRTIYDKETLSQLQSYDEAIKQVKKALKSKLLFNEVKAMEDGFWTNIKNTLFGGTIESRAKAAKDLARGIKNIGYGIAASATDPNLYLQGLPDFVSSQRVLNLKNKLDKGEGLNSAERDMLNALAVNAVVNNNYGAFEEVGGFKAGKVATESIPFMIDFMLTRGVLGSIEKAGTKAVAGGVTRSAAAKASRFISGELGRSMMKKAVDESIEALGKEGVKAAIRRNIAKIPGFLTTLSGDAVNALLIESTLLLPKTISDINKLQTGYTSYEEDAEGNIVGTGFYGGVDDPEAIRVGLTRNWIENFSEMMGEWGIGHFIGKVGAKGLQSVGLGNVVDVLTKAGSYVKNHIHTKAMNLFQAGQYHGLFGEMSEEYYGLALEHLMNVSESKENFWGEVNPFTATGRKTFMDIFGGIALSTAFLGSIGVSTYLYNERNYNRAKAEGKRVFGDKWDTIEDTIVNADQSALPRIMSALTGMYKSKDEVYALLRYYGTLESYRGSSYAEQAKLEDRRKTKLEEAQEEAKRTGYRVADIIGRQSLKLAADKLRNMIGYEVGEVEDLDNYIETVKNAYGSLDDFIAQNPEIGNRWVAMNIIESLNDGIRLSDYDDINQRLDNVASFVNMILNNGKVVHVTYGNGMSGYVVKGNVHEKTEDTFVVRRADGSINVVNKDDIHEVNEYDTKPMIYHMRKNVLQNYVKLDEERNKQSQLKTGSVIDLEDGRTLSVLGTARNGDIIYSVTDDENVTVMHQDPQATVREVINNAIDTQSGIIVQKALNKAKSVTSPDVIADDKVQGFEAAATETLEEFNRRRAEESSKDIKTFIPTRQTEMSKNDSKFTFNKLRGTIKKLKDAKNFGEFLLILRDSKINIDRAYEGRLSALYTALKSGEIDGQEFAAVFVPEQFRKDILSKKALKRFNELNIDIDGTVTRARKQKGRTVRLTPIVEPTPVVEEQPVTPTEEPAVQPEVVKRPYIAPTFTSTDFEEPSIPYVPYMPLGTDAEAAAATLRSQSEDAQQKTVDLIYNKIDQDKENVLLDKRTPQEYFIKVDGKVVRFKRVHSVLDDQYEQDPIEQALINLVETQLGNLFSQLDKTLYYDLVRNLLKDKEVDVDFYIQYIKDNESDTNEIADVNRSIAVISQRSTPGISVQYGNLVDEVCRRFFEGETLKYSDFENRMSLTAFDQMVSDLKQLAQVFKQRKWVVITEPIVFHAELYDNNTRRTVRVAGETDMVAVDENGGIHILDVKTSYKKFYPVYDKRDGSIIDPLNVINTLKDGRKAKRTTIEQYSRLLTMYSLLEESNVGQFIQSISLIPWHLKYNFGPTVYLEGSTNQYTSLEDQKAGKTDTYPLIVTLTRDESLINRYGMPQQDVIDQQRDYIDRLYSAIEQQLLYLSELCNEYDGRLTDQNKLMVANASKMVSQWYDRISSPQYQDGNEDFVGIIQQGETILSHIDFVYQYIQESARYEEQQEVKNTIVVTNKTSRTKPISNDNIPDWQLVTTTYWKSTLNSLGTRDACAINLDGTINPNLRLKDVSGNPDFINNATFVFGYNSANKRITVLVTYKGNTYQPVDISCAHTSSGRAFYHSVLNQLNAAKDGQVVIPVKSPSRTSGKIIEGVQASLIDKGFVSTTRKPGTLYIYDIEYTNDLNTFGTTNERNGRTVVVKPGQVDNSKEPMYLFNTDTKLKGTVVMLAERQYDEVTASKPVVPVNLLETSYSKEDIDLIVGILTGEYCVNKTLSPIGRLQQPFVENGQSKGLTNMQVLNLLLHYGQTNRKAKEHIHVEFDLHNQNIVKLVGNVKGDPENQIQTRTYDFSIAEKIDEFRTFLKDNVHRNIDEQLMGTRLASTINDSRHPLFGLKQFLNSSIGRQFIQGGNKLQFGNSTLVFDMSDFKDPTNSSDTKGLSGLAWYIKRGFFLTNFEGFEDTLLNFDETAGVTTVNKDTLNQGDITSDDNVTKLIGEIADNLIVDENPIQDLQDDIGLAMELSLDKRQRIDKSEEKKITIAEREQQVRDNIKRIAGDVDVSIVDKLIEVIDGNVSVLGRCYADSIILSELAFQGVEYHESFHRVVELLFTQKERDRIYERYKKAKKWKKGISDSELREAMADDFMYYAMNVPTFKLNNILRPFKYINAWIKLLKQVGSFRLLMMYRHINKGKYAKREVSDENRRRWELIAHAKDANVPSYLNFEKRGQKLDHVFDEYEYKSLIKSISYIILRSQTNGVDWYDFSVESNDVLDDLNANWADFNITGVNTTKEFIMNSNAWKKWMASRLPQATKDALNEFMQYWDLVRPDVISYICQQAGVDYSIRYEEVNDANKDGVQADPLDPNDEDEEPTTSEEDIENGSIDNHTKASYEISPFSRLSLKVKWFFAGISNSANISRADGTSQAVLMLNDLGLPEFFDTKTVYASFLNEMHGCRNINQLLEKLKNASNIPMYAQLYSRFKKLYDETYNSGEIDLNKEALLISIFKSIRLNKNQFNIIQSYTDEHGVKSLRVFSMDADYQAKNYTKDWSNQFASGSSMYVKRGDNGTVAMKGNFTPAIFGKVYDLFYGATGMNYAFSQVGKANVKDASKPHYTINGIAIDATQLAHVLMCKLKVIAMLRSFGIIISMDEFDYMLLHKYGDAGSVGMTSFLQNSGESNFLSFCQYVSTFGANGVLNIPNINSVFTKNGFVKDLANWKYEYAHSHGQLSVKSIDNKTFYVMAENNLITDRLDEILNDPLFLDRLMSTKFAIIPFNNDQLIGELTTTYAGSMILKHVATNQTTPLRFNIFPGMKTDEVNDSGASYEQLSKRDDYIAKAALLAEGYIIIPTLSDKKTWGYISGLKIPGLDYKNLMLSMPKVPFVKEQDGHYLIPFSNEVLDQMIEYTLTEDAAVEVMIDNADNVPDSEKIDNFDIGLEVTDKNGISHTVVQGGRYRALTGIYVNPSENITGNDVDDNGFVSFNKTLDKDGNYLDEYDNYKIAHKYFFDPREVIDPVNGNVRLETQDELRERQREIMRRILSRRVEEQVKYVQSIGLIEYAGTEGVESINAYKNIGLDLKKINEIYSNLFNSIPSGNRTTSSIDDCKSQAILLYLADISVKHIMSTEEFYRVFSGDPAAFKFKYDKNGVLYDTTSDLSKRLGGLSSTGANSVELEGIPTTYRCAEVDNEMQELDGIDEVGELIYDGLLRSNLLRYRLEAEHISFDSDHERKDGISDKERAEQLSDEVDAMTKEEVEATLPASTLEVVKRIAKAKTDAFRINKKEHLDGIDVADGGSYITDTMCEYLLRIDGKYTNEIRRAFKILRGEEVDGRVYTVKDTRALAEAYNLVYTTVIGTQKYTAYGLQFRTVGHECQATPYYHKMALFPLFKTICTGKMANVYLNMKNNNIDQLLIKSAVKVGSQGSKSIDWNDWTDKEFSDKTDGFKFNTYEREYKYLRKQFNTDPKELELMKTGTQMTKQVLSTLIHGRKYSVDGTEMSAVDLRNDIMSCMNQLSRIGMGEAKALFLDEAGNYDPTLFSKTITQELQRRGASSELLDAVSIIDRVVKDKDGNPKKNEKGEIITVKDTKVPLEALSQLNFILSIIKSVIDKRVVDINAPGKAFYQRSVWAMEGATTVLNDDDLPPSLYEGNKLQINNEDKSMDCVLSIDFFYDILKNAKVKTGRKVNKKVKRKRMEYATVTKDGVTTTDYTKTVEVEREEVIQVDEKVSVSTLSFDEQKQWLIEHGIISGRKKDGTWSDAKANIVGYRIPTQAMSSIHALRCVDVIPVVRDTVILPAAFTKITGSDFDIDKLFLSTLYYNSDGTTEFEEGTREYYTNKLFNDYITILKDSDRSFSELNGSIDNDTSLLKDIIGDIEANQKKNAVHPYSMYTLEKQSGTKDEFVSGKMGIGPYALNANNHILTMLYDVHFAYRDNSILSWLGLNSLAKSSDRYGNSIMSWLSGLINAHVDVAKDSYISRLGVNKYTYNLVSLLVRTGLGKETFYMTTQPIMKRLSEAYSNANGVYMVNHNKSKSTVIREMESAVILDMVESHTGTRHKSIESAFDEFLQSKVFDAQVAHTSLEEASQLMNRIQMTGRTDDANLSMAKNLIQTIFAKDSDILRLISKNPPKDINQDNRTFEVNVIVNEDTQEQVEINLSVYDVQMIVALANEKFKMYSQALSNLVMYTKIDTKKEGKTLIEQRKYEEGYRQLFGKNSRSPIRHLFDTLSLDRLNEDSYIETKTNNATLLFRDVLSTQLIEATDEFDMQLDRLLNVLGKTSQDMEAVRSVSKAIKAYIKSRFFFDSSVQGGLKYDHIEATHLVTGDNTIYDRLLQISTKMLTDPSYSDLVNKLNGMPKNYLLRNLVTSNTYRFIPDNVVGTYADQFNNAKFVQLISVMNDDMIDPDQVSKAWSELLNDTAHPELQKFARDLIVYAFITSGDNGGVNDLFKYVPVEWKLSSGYADYMRNMLIDYQNNRAPILDYEDIILNNWYDRTFIPEESLSDYATKKSKFRKWMTHPITGYPIMLAALDDDREATIDENGPLYIKIRRSDKDSKVNGLRQYTIYKRVAFGISKKLDGNRTIKVRYPIYAMIDPRGNKFSKVHKIYAMSFDPQYSETSNVIQSKIGQLAKILGVTVTDPLSVLEKFSEYASNHVMLDGKVDGLIWVVRAMKNNVIEESLASILAGYIREHSEANPMNTNVLPTVNYYQGNIVPSVDTIFVFGSNTQGRHGAGNARVASEMFGATYGVPEGLQGSSYAIITKDLTKPKSQQLRSVSKELIIEGIKRMYETARTMPNYKFKVAYTNRLDEVTRNGYTGKEMIDMFKEAGPIPSNVYFSEVWARSGEFDEPLTTIPIDNIPTPTTPAANTYPVPNKSEAPTNVPTASYGVEVSDGSKDFWNKVNAGWLNQHPNGIIAYRKHGSTAESFTEEVVNSGWLGNPFDWQKYGEVLATKMYYNWLKNGNSYNEPLATEESRQAAIQKILSTPEGSPVLYYKELGRPSHATVIGYLINNKQLLQLQPKQQATINIYAGTGENADLSNFAERPFTVTNVGDDASGPIAGNFKTVEGAFQAQKLAYTKNYTDVEIEEAKARLEKASGSEARRIGRSLLGLDTNAWDNVSSGIMKNLLLDSFKENPQALQRLLATGDAILTHTQDKGKWGTEFPRLLMEVRDELRQSSQLNNAENNKNDSERFAGVQESELTISSEKTILSNDELRYWNEHGVDNMPRILVASERTDPVFHVNEILDILNGVKSVSQWGVVNGRRQVVGLISGKEFAGLYLITKHDGIPMKRLLETKIPKLIHFSITGLGGTEYEPGVMKPDDLLDRIKEYISMGLDPDSVTIRIDPIVPGITTPRMIENIIKRASEMGIKHIRFSIMDAYQNTVTALEKVGYDFNTNYGINPKTGKYNFNAKQEKFDKIVDFMLLMSDKYGVSLGSCAENIVKRGISKEGCLSVSAVNKMLGINIEDKGVDNNQQRDLCSCYGGKIDALAYGKNCASHCIYCYAKHENDVAMQYYNEDGTLKDNDFTRTSPRQQPNQPTKRTPISTPSTPIQIYSDGSDIKGTGAIGYGAVFMHNGKAYGLSGTEASDEVSKLKQLFPDAKFSNPTMEMLALTTTLEHFASLGIGEHIEINQDYKGAVNFGDLWKYSEGSAQREAKAWKPKEAYIAHLVDRASAAINTIVNNGGSVKIRWVKGHQTSGTEQARMNDLADSYAKSRDIYNNMSDVYGTTQQNDNSNDYNSNEYGNGEEMNHCNNNG